MAIARPAKKRPGAQKAIKPRPSVLEENEGVEIETVPLVVWVARFSVYFLAQGAIMLLAYAIKGFDTDPLSFPVGFRIDPTHAVIRLVVGLVGTYVGFFRPRYATAFILVFAALYTVLTAFTPYHLGMQYGLHIKLLPWLVLAVVWAIGLYGLWRDRRAA
ncbi:MAG: hypothetical protein WBW08_02465 [Methyloceanibacter sp.]|jgi:hypothetical protein